MTAAILAVGVLIAVQALAQEVLPEADVQGAADKLVRALDGKNGWLAVAGSVLGLLVQVLKTPLGFGLLAGTSSTVRFWIPFGVGAAAGLLEKVISGGSWASAVVTTLLIALPAVTTRRMVEVNGGERILPTAKPPA
jgi:uncharacterized membrane protein